MTGIKILCTLFEKYLELMHSWGFALREGVFAETKEGICTLSRNKDKKASFKNS